VRGLMPRQGLKQLPGTGHRERKHQPVGLGEGQRPFGRLVRRASSRRTTRLRPDERPPHSDGRGPGRCPRAPAPARVGAASRWSAAQPDITAGRDDGVRLRREVGQQARELSERLGRGQLVGLTDGVEQVEPERLGVVLAPAHLHGASRRAGSPRSAQARSSDVFPLPAGAEMVVTCRADARSGRATRPSRAISGGRASIDSGRF
jgi:hypothetical protein